MLSKALVEVLLDKCLLEGCARPKSARGLCRKHYEWLPDMKEKKRAYAAVNREKTKKRRAEWLKRPGVRERIRASRREYGKSPRMREYMRSYQRTYYLRPDVRSKRAQKALTVARRYTAHLHSAKARGLVNELSRDDYDTLTQQPCRYCGGFSEGRSHVGVDRIDNAIGYTKPNSIPCCERCNWMKCEMRLVDFLAHVRRIAEVSCR